MLMVRELRFRVVLPIVEAVIAALFGAIGLWQRSAILSHPFFEGQTMWDTTARFHVWPWPYKFAAILNLPAFFGGLLMTIPIGAIRPTLPEAVQIAPTLVFVWMLWHWIGSRFDRRWTAADKAPWIAVLIFTLVSFGGAFAHLGYTGFLPYGLLVWVIALVAINRCTSKYPQFSRIVGD